MPQLSAALQRVAESIIRAANRAAKPEHLRYHLGAFEVQAGRIVREATEAGHLADTRWPARYRGIGEILSAPPESETRRVGGGLLGFDGSEPSFAIAIWRQAIAWLAKTYPAEMQTDSTAWHWSRIATRGGKLIGRDGKPVRVVATRNGKPAKLPPPGKPIPDDLSLKLVPTPARVGDFDDPADQLERLRARAEIDATACRIIAELIAPAAKQPATDADLWSEFSQGDRDVLLTMLKHNANDPDRMLSADRVVGLSGIKVRSVKRAMATLLRHHLTKSKQGRGGGYWLTAAGVAFAEGHRR